jgi:hypothetical protein
MDAGTNAPPSMPLGGPRGIGGGVSNASGVTGANFDGTYLFVSPPTYYGAGLAPLRNVRVARLAVAEGTYGSSSKAVDAATVVNGSPGMDGSLPPSDVNDSNPALLAGGPFARGPPSSEYEFGRTETK